MFFINIIFIVFSHSPHSDDLIFRKIKKVYDPKGVKLEDPHNNIICNIYYINYSLKNNLGIRRNDNIIYYEMRCNENVNVLNFNKPCLCGSFTHTKIYHHDCILNPRYEDACITQ